MSLFVFATKDKYIRLTLLLLNENTFMVLLHSFGAKHHSFPLLFEQEQLGYLNKFSFCVPQMKEQSFIFFSTISTSVLQETLVHILLSFLSFHNETEDRDVSEDSRTFDIHRC